MDDPDSQMEITQAERESQSETMEFDVDYAQPGDAGATAHDAEMEDGHDPSASEMREEMLEGDAEMAAEMHEQEMKSDERDWGDRDAEQHSVDIEAGAADSTDAGAMHPDNADGDQDGTSKEAHLNGSGEVGEASEAIDPSRDLHESTTTHSDPIDKAHIPTNKGKPPTDAESRESQADEVEPVQYEPEEDGNAVAENTAEDPVGDASKPVNEMEDEEEDRYADVPIDTNKSDLHTDADIAHAQHATNGTATNSTSVPRPTLQKDGLEPIDLFSGQEAYAPHVSLLYNNASYSLFRPSSSPSGDHENVLLGDEEAGDHDLYFASLDTLIQSLHETLPDLSGDGENEIILDFGPLDMQVSQDNVYAGQLSLFDFDRIRVGMCQPELDRLSINLIVGKRLVHRFNELAEHCFRMYTGDDDDNDSGTIRGYEDTEHQAEDEEAADYEDAEDPAEAEAPEVDPDLTTEENVGDLPEAAKDAVESSLPSHADEDAEKDSAVVQNEQKAAEDGLGAHQAQGSRIASDDAANDNAAAEDENADDEQEAQKLQSEIDNQAQKQDEEEGVEEETLETVDPDAPLEEAAEQAEEYEEAAYEEEEAAEAEGEADADPAANAGELNDPAVSRPTKNLFRSEEEPQYYENLDSLAGDEDVVLVERPDTAAALDKAAADIADIREAQQHASDESAGSTLPRSASKRSHEDLTGKVDGEEAPPAASSANGESKRAKIAS